MRLIDADAFIQMMEEKCDPESILDPWVLSVCRGGVKMMPTVDAVPVRHGRWIYEERDRLDYETDDGRVFRTEKWWKCSECGNAKGYIGHKPSDKFCSNCGADMREDGDGNG